MATPFKLKRSSIEGKRPQIIDLELGELGYNFNDGRLFARKENIGIGSTVTLLNVWTENSDKSIFYIDGNVGIGTTISSTKLTINGNVIVSENLSTQTLSFSTDTSVPIATGQLTWNQTEATLDVGLLNGVSLQLGQEEHFYAKAASPISNGQLVMFSGVQGDHILVEPSDLQSVGFKDSYIMGVATQNFTTNDFGYITSFGKVKDIDTVGWIEGDILYADPNNVGIMTNVKPTAPNHSIQIAAVLRSHQTEGIILVRPTFGSHLEDLHNVGIDTTTLTNNDILIYNSSTETWQNSQLPSPPSGNFLQSRTIVTGVTTSIVDSGIGNTDIAGFKSYALMKVGLSTAGWLRLYTDNTSRENDASRSQGVDPTPGSGVIAEVVTTGISTTQIVSPFIIGGNLDDPEDVTIYAAITNLSGSTQEITANLTILQLEA